MFQRLRAMSMRRNAKVVAFVAASVLVIGCLINKTFPKQNESCTKQKTIYEIKAIVSVERPTASDIKRAKYAREIKEELQNLWHATEFEFKRVLRSNDRNKSIDQAEKDLLQTIWALEIQLENIQSLDRTWQVGVANKTTNMVSDLIDSHQNPNNCNERGQLFGHQVCSYGCMVHNILEQFYMSLSNNKTLFTYPFGCTYLESEITLKKFFQPFSKNCSLRTGDWKEVETHKDLKGKRAIVYLESAHECSGTSSLFSVHRRVVEFN
ncbi:uncharacterized protein LOC100176676 [Ciona intestinalis]